MDDDRKAYLTKGIHEIDLTPLDAKGGVSMIVVPVDQPESPSKVYVVEIGHPSGFATGLYEA